MSRIFAVLAEITDRRYWRNSDLCFPPCSLSTLSLLTSFTTVQQTSAIAQEHVYLQNSVGVWAEWGVCFEKSGGKFPCLSARHCSVSLKVHACGWETKPAESCLSILVEKQPPTDRPAVYLQGGSHIRKMLTYREHINSPAGCQTVPHFARRLLCA